MMRVTAAMREQAPLLAYAFDGESYSPELDRARLSTQMDRVRALMADGGWRTLAEIQAACGGSEAGVSARLRDLRKVRNGAWKVERRRRGEGKSGLFEYRTERTS